MNDWFRIANEDAVSSPALLVYPDRVEQNLRRMCAMAGGPERLRPHVKTHKLPQIVELKLRLGITKFKAATIAEAEMCAMAGAPDVLLAYQPVGPNVRRLLTLVRTYPKTKFSCLADNAASVAALSAAAAAAQATLDVYLDVNVGMNRTGVAPGPEAYALYRSLSSAPGLQAAGLHGYDGHLHDFEGAELEQRTAAAFDTFWRLRDDLLRAGLDVPRTVAGGTSTFPVHARAAGVELGAGTSVMWDCYKHPNAPDASFLNAVMILTRVISRPSPNRLCLDLGHKAVASELPHPRVHLMGLEAPAFPIHSEEHLVVETPQSADFPVGTVLYGIPRHVCPTMALHNEVWVVREGRAEETWPVRARGRRITI